MSYKTTLRLNMNLDVLNNKEDLVQFANEYDLRADWHEPDEEGISAFVVGNQFDNADIEKDMGLILVKNGKPIAFVNLALLCAWASGYGDDNKCIMASGAIRLINDMKEDYLHNITKGTDDERHYEMEEQRINDVVSSLKTIIRG
jgi:hypothetical protein